MDTQLVDTYRMEETELLNLFRGEWQQFFAAKSNRFEAVFTSFEALLEHRWIVLEDDNAVYDHNIKALWPWLMDETASYKIYDSNTKLATIFQEFKEDLQSLIGLPLDLPSREELFGSFTNIKHAPFDITNGRPQRPSCYYLYKYLGYAQGVDCDNNCYGKTVEGYAVPLVRITNQNNFNLANRAVFFRFLALGLIPKEKNFLCEFDAYPDYVLLQKEFASLNPEIKDFFDIQSLRPNNQPVLTPELVAKSLLDEDKIRADLEPYNPKIVHDTNLGHWGLFQDHAQFTKAVEIKLSEPLVAKNPKSSINNGVVGIDFGTKSTVVVYQKDNVNIHPMRVGTGKLNQQTEQAHYENPTILQCVDLEGFIQAYRQRSGRPYTKWEQLTISHTAFNNMNNSKSESFNTFVSELKQWAGNKQRKIKLVDEHKKVIDLPPFLELTDDDFNPIEVYAYYLGLYINNLRNGIFLNYILSFPVTYELPIREKIITSFKKGIKKSLPQELHDQMDVDKELTIYAGASEPAAYAVIALKAYDFDPSGDEKVFYGVFDFGGGTTDFDFGIFRESDHKNRKERRFDYVIEHFGAGGDRFLGGENLLELLAFELFKSNKQLMIEKEMQFTLPPECDVFLGSETLLDNTQEAQKNIKTLMSALRPFWESTDESYLDTDEIKVNLFDKHAVMQTNVELTVDKAQLEAILRTRIQKGVKNFFHGLRGAFSSHRVNLQDVDKINIFLAGNASKYKHLQELFQHEMQAEEEDIRQHIELKQDDVFTLFPPLASDDMEKPTGKTGVAFGLIKTRKGGDIKVIDHNLQDSDDIRFKYYLGESRKNRFKVVIDRDTAYNQWLTFIDASEDVCEVYFSSSDIVSSNQIDITDDSIQKKQLRLDKTHVSTANRNSPKLANKTSPLFPVF